MATPSNKAAGNPAHAFGGQQNHGKCRVCRNFAGVIIPDFGKQVGDAVAENHSDHDRRQIQLVAFQHFQPKHRDFTSAPPAKNAVTWLLAENKAVALQHLQPTHRQQQEHQEQSPHTKRKAH